MTEGTRLNKFLASCGVGSRRACDELIQSGRVEINGRTCDKLATRVAEGDHVRVDGRRVSPQAQSTIAFHKPRGLVCTREDEMGRDTIYELLPGSLRTLHHVGRLDRESEGLLILTNDGDLSQRLMHPSKSVEKEYYVTANQPFESVHLDQFLVGIYTEDQVKLRAKSIERLSPRRIKVVLDHGAKRQIRVMFEALGYRVTKLLRVRIGSLWLGDLPPGRWAALTAEEIELLLRNPAAGGASGPVVKPATRARKSAAPPPPRSGGAGRASRQPPGRDGGGPRKKARRKPL